MKEGEFRALSLGSLALIVGAIALWAAVWGPDDSPGIDGHDESTGAQQDSAQQDSSQQNSVDGPVIRAPFPYDHAGDDAEVGGVLVLWNGCVVFERGVGAEATHMPVIWPAGTSWDPVTEEVVLDDGVRVEIGGTVSGGGGYPYASELGHLDEAGQRLAQSCADNEWSEVARFNNNPGEIDRVG